MTKRSSSICDYFSAASSSRSDTPAEVEDNAREDITQVEPESTEETGSPVKHTLSQARSFSFNKEWQTY